MNLGGWRYIAASVIGSSHEKVGGTCQDAHDCQIYQMADGASVLVASVADGAGTAVCGGDGAVRTCTLFSSLVNDHLSSGSTVEQISRVTAQFWLGVIQSSIAREAESLSRTSRDFACTLLGVISSPRCTACIQIGDGVIVVADAEESTYGHVFWPDRGEYANTTHFVCEETAADHLRFESIQRELVDVALLTDGLQNIALNYQQQSAHDPFFKGLFAPLRAMPEGRSAELSTALASFLSSPKVNAKTDDDKTLLLASRLASSGEAR